jgi:hypothetical protein
MKEKGRRCASARRPERKHDNMFPVHEFDSGGNGEPLDGLDRFERQVRELRKASGLESETEARLYSVQPSSRDATIAAGERALDELPTIAKEQIWDRWMLVAAALEAMRQEGMFRAQCNEPQGARYMREYRSLIRGHRFDRIGSSDRARLLECLDNRVAIEKWLAALPTNKRLKITHPLVILRNWKAAQKPNLPSPILDPDNPKPPTKLTLREEHAVALEKIARLEGEIAKGGGDLWNRDDRPEDIARVMLSKLSAAKAERVARAMLKLLKERSS